MKNLRSNFSLSSLLFKQSWTTCLTSGRLRISRNSFRLGEKTNLTWRTMMKISWLGWWELWDQQCTTFAKSTKLQAITKGSSKSWSIHCTTYCRSVQATKITLETKPLFFSWLKSTKFPKILNSFIKIPKVPSLILLECWRLCLTRSTKQSQIWNIDFNVFYQINFDRVFWENFLPIDNIYIIDIKPL